MGCTELVGIPGREPQPELRPPEPINVRWEPWAAVCGDEWGAAPQDRGEVRGGDRCSAVGMAGSLPAGGPRAEEVAPGDRWLELPPSLL